MDNKRARYNIGTEVVNGLSVGRDPRKISSDEFEEMGIKDTPLLKIIREKCLDCCCGEQNEVRDCTCVSCSLWPYRMNKNPFRKRNLTDKQREELADRLSKSRNKSV